MPLSGARRSRFQLGTAGPDETASPTALCSFRCSQTGLSACTSPSRSVWALSHQSNPAATTVQRTCSGTVPACPPPHCCQCVPAAACIECTRLGAGGSLLGQCPLRNCIVRGIRAASITELCFVEKIPCRCVRLRNVLMYSRVRVRVATKTKSANDNSSLIKLP